MAGLYLHIPFCKQACHYCDFHFSTSLKLKDALLEALCNEIGSRSDELENQLINTIYLGGGTPSILEVDEIRKILEIVYANYNISSSPEITLEANPDDLTRKKIKQLSETDINRLSIGVQSFFEEDLKYMNRVHTASESEASIKAAQDAGFENMSIDLIYGTPSLSNENWMANLRKTIQFEVPHISCYALTVEEKTPLASLIRKKKLAMVDDAKIADQFGLMIEVLLAGGFEQYEISNFSKPGSRSRHNSSYWAGSAYAGIGPGAHSYNGKNLRRWNISNNAQYVHLVSTHQKYYEEEALSELERYNEFIMTKIRLLEGISLIEIETRFGLVVKDHVLAQVEKWNKNNFVHSNDHVVLTNAGKIVSDGLAADLFMVK